MTQNYRLFLVFLFVSVATCNLFAQSTNPSPYCYPTASNMTAGSCTLGAGFNLQSVKLNTLNQSGSCYGSSNSDVYRYWSSTTTLKAGGKYTLTVVTPYSSWGYNVSAGAWIDFNQNNSFEPSELIGADLSKNNIYNGGITHNLAFTVPCSATSGKTRMRVRSQYNTKVSGADTCSCPGGYGETWDFDITIASPGSVVAGLTMPTQAFVKSAFNSIVDNSNEYTWHDMDVNNDGTYESKGVIRSNSKLTSVFATTGTKCVKLKSSNCISTDSVVKCISIVNPTGKPVVGFTKVSPCEKVIEVYSGINLIDTSGQGPYIWKWNIYDSITFKNDPYDPYSDENSGYVVFDNGTNNTSQSPFVSFYREGIYSVELIATNGVGTSKMTKKSYIKVISPITYFMGFGTYGANNDNRVASDFGRLIDDGGPNNNYGNKQGRATKSFLIINPAATRPISMKFEQLRLKDTKDSIKIYDDDKMDPSKLLAVLTSANNGTYPTYTSTNNKMYFYFTSDSSGNDSGYQAQYTNTGVYQYSTVQNISMGHNLLFVNQKSVFYNENQNVFGFNYNKIWSVNDTVQTAYNNMDTFKYKFKYAGTQKVCLEMINCYGSFKKCENLLFESGLMGVVYKDNNSNCAYNSGDKLMPNIHMKLFDSTANSWSHYYTDALGQYNFNKGTGTYKVAIDASGMPFRTICATPGTDSLFRLSGTTPYRTINFDIGCKSGHDVGTQSVWTSGPVFPGRKHELHVSAGDMNKWFGLNCTSNLSGSVVITVSGKLSYVSPVSGALTPTSVSGNVFTYSVSDFSNISNNSDFGLLFKTDTSAKANDTISILVRVTPLSGDIDTTNNTFRYRYRVSNSYDPNMKEVYPDEIADGFKDWLTYTIHFQNTGNAPAFDIRLQDTLDNQLDPETFQLLNYSHNVSTTLASRVLSFKFNDIMLPDSFSNEKGSHGFVQFRIKPKAALTKGAKIANRAFIYFDYNEPVVTNTVSNEVLPKGVNIPDPAFAAWLTANYPASMYKGYRLDTSSTDIKKATSVDVSGKNIFNLYGIQFFIGLENLNCSGNQLATLPQLPVKMTTLNCANNGMKSLPSLPSVLNDLNCSGNTLSSIPALPSALQILHCENNQLSSLPLLPSVLNKLYCGNNKISCFEKFSESISTLDVAGNTYKCLPNYITAMDAATKAAPICIKGDAVNNPGNCNSAISSCVFIPDMNFAAWLSAVYPTCMFNGSWMDTSCSDIKNAGSVNVAGKGIANLFGLQFFVSLKTLNCSGNVLTGLPVLPLTITHVNCERNKISTFNAFPSTLQVLRCNNNYLTVLPTLPTGLTYLSCSDNQIGSLPALPNGLKDLYCDRNQLTSLPLLPAALNNLSCIGNKISSLLYFPSSLSTIICDSNQLSDLPALPSGLGFLSCEFNQLNQLPPLPSGLKSLYCSNNKIICFERFSDNITAIDISANKNKCLPNYINAMDAGTKSVPICLIRDNINNPDNCPGQVKDAIRKVESGAADVVVYPNPGSGFYKISLPDILQNQMVKVEVYNVLGELIYSATTNNGILQIDITEQTDGVYLLKIEGVGMELKKALIKG